MPSRVRVVNSRPNTPLKTDTNRLAVCKLAEVGPNVPYEVPARLHLVRWLAQLNGRSVMRSSPRATIVPDRPCEGDLPKEVADSQDLSMFLSDYRGSPQVGCQSASIEGGFTHITLRYPHPETGNLCTLQLRAELVAGHPVISMGQKNHAVGYNERSPDTEYHST